MIDSHCHLDLITSDPAEIDSLIREAVAGGVDEMLCVSVDRQNVTRVREIANRHAGVVHASAGIHPNVVTEEQPCSQDELAQLADHPEVIAVGETGLDYFRDTDGRQQQISFRNHVRVARQLGKPLIIHMRDAAEDTLRVLREERADTVGGIMHCFVEDWSTALKAMDMGFLISFSGIVTFKSARQIQDVARRVPRDQMLVETDAPWLAPVPHRGSTNRPLWVREVGAFVARLREESPADIARWTSENFYRLFGLDSAAQAVSARAHNR